MSRHRDLNGTVRLLPFLHFHLSVPFCSQKMLAPADGTYHLLPQTPAHHSHFASVRRAASDRRKAAGSQRALPGRNVLRITEECEGTEDWEKPVRPEHAGFQTFTGAGSVGFS